MELVDCYSLIKKWNGSKGWVWLALGIIAQFVWQYVAVPWWALALGMNLVVIQLYCWARRND